MPRLVVVVSGTAGSTALSSGSSPGTSIDVNGNLVYNGTPLLLIQAVGLSYNALNAGAYTLAEADAAIQQGVAGGLNCLLEEGWPTDPYPIDLYFGSPVAEAVYAKYGLFWNGGAAKPNASEIINITTHKDIRQVILWNYFSEPDMLQYVSNLAHYAVIRQYDPLHPVVSLEIIRGGNAHSLWSALGSQTVHLLTVFDAGQWDETVNAVGVNIPVVEIIANNFLSQLWEYLLFMDRRVRMIATALPYPSVIPTAVDAGIAGVMNGEYTFVYTWATGTYHTADSIESFASPPSAPITVTNSQITVTVTNGPASVTAKNIYARKTGSSATDGHFPTSGYRLAGIIADNTTTAMTINLDYPSWANGAPPPAVATLGWIPSISTTPVGELFGYISIVTPPPYDAVNRWYWLQVACNCRAFEVLFADWERGPNGNNDPVVGALTQNTQITFTSNTAGDTRTCSIEGLLTDGVTVAREENLTLPGGTTPSVISANTYSLVKWVACQQGHATASITVIQATNGHNILQNITGGHAALTIPPGSYKGGGFALFKGGPDGLPAGYGQNLVDTWTVLGRISALSGLILDAAIWKRIAAVTPAYAPYNDTQNTHSAQGIYAAVKNHGGFTYVIAINVDEDYRTSPVTQNPLPGATIDIGAFQQTIHTCVRIAGESGSPSFLGSVITDDFVAMGVHVYRIT